MRTSSVLSVLVAVLLALALAAARPAPHLLRWCG